MASVLIFDAHLGVVGGAQRVTGLLASAVGPGHEITIASPEKFDAARFVELYGVPVPPCETVGVGNVVADISSLSATFDVFICNQCPWVPPRAKRNLMYVHFPLHSAHRKVAGIPTPLRAPDFYGREYDAVMVNSEFTRGWVRKRWAIDARVVYVYASLDGGSWDPAAKTPTILSVSRFQEEKAQGHVLDAFLEMEPAGWELVLAGHAYDKAYVERLRARAAGRAVRFELEPSADGLRRLYREASIFWHLRGLEEEDTPDQLEHFGLVVVEAMSHGAVPVVYDGGGHPEIVVDRTGFLIRERSELILVTRTLIESEVVRRAAAEAAVARSKVFNKERFDAGVRALL